MNETLFRVYNISILIFKKENDPNQMSSVNSGPILFHQQSFNQSGSKEKLQQSSGETTSTSYKKKLNVITNAENIENNNPANQGGSNNINKPHGNNKFHSQSHLRHPKSNYNNNYNNKFHHATGGGGYHHANSANNNNNFHHHQSTHFGPGMRKKTSNSFRSFNSDENESILGSSLGAGKKLKHGDQSTGPRYWNRTPSSNSMSSSSVTPAASNISSTTQPTTPTEPV